MNGNIFVIQNKLSMSQFTWPSAPVKTLVETALLFLCASRCLLSALGPSKLLGQRWHLWPREPVCRATCSRSFLVSLNPLPQTSHLKGVSPVCHLMCTSNLIGREKKNLIESLPCLSSTLDSPALVHVLPIAELADEGLVHLVPLLVEGEVTLVETLFAADVAGEQPL